MITRTEFIKRYAADSGRPEGAKYARLGIFEVDDVCLMALPCGCDGEQCEGWMMASAHTVLSHLFFGTPGKLRDAYREAVKQAGGE